MQILTLLCFAAWSQSVICSEVGKLQSFTSIRFVYARVHIAYLTLPTFSEQADRGENGSAVGIKLFLTGIELVMAEELTAATSLPVRATLHQLFVSTQMDADYEPHTQPPRTHRLPTLSSILHSSLNSILHTHSKCNYPEITNVRYFCVRVRGADTSHKLVHSTSVWFAAFRNSSSRHEGTIVGNCFQDWL